jgi:signal transduction histidine kinase
MSSLTIPGGLRQRFFFMTVAIYLVTALGSYAVLAWIVDGIANRLGVELAEKEVLYNKERGLQPLLREIALARKMADSPLLRSWARAEADPALKTQAIAELESYRRSYRDGSYFFVVAASGNYYFNDARGGFDGRQLRYTLDSAKPDDAWYFATLKKSQEVQLNVNPDAHLKVTKVWINVLMKEGDEVLGVVGTGIDLSRFVREIVEGTQPGLFNVFIDRNGAIQAHKDTSMIDFASLTKDMGEQRTIFSLVDSVTERQALGGAMGRLIRGDSQVETTFLTLDGQRYLAGMVHLREIGWIGLVLMDLSVLIEQGQFVPVALLFGVSLLVALGSTALLLHRLVLVRVARLDTSTRRIAEGDYSVEIPEGPPDEVGRLALSFKRMADTIFDHTQNLEQRVAERTTELNRINTELQHFSYVISHDLREPLRTISNYLKLLNRRYSDHLPPDAREFVGFAVDGAQRMDRMIVNLLEYSRAGRSDREPGPVDMAVVTRQALASLDQAIRRAGAVLEVGELPTVTGDATLLGGLMQNLIGNALKYRAPDRQPAIRVAAERSEGKWLFRVADNGIGIDPEFHDRVFQIFQRLHTDAEIEGAGIGLASCKRIVERHGGRIWVESVPGQGSDFLFTLPVAAAC